MKVFNLARYKKWNESCKVPRYIVYGVANWRLRTSRSIDLINLEYPVKVSKMKVSNLTRYR
jgi:hypothetical protein